MMKLWMRFAALLLTLLMALAACAPAVDPETPDEGKEGSEQEAEPPAPVAMDIFKDGKTEYTLVFDDSNRALSEMVYRYVDALKNKYDITLEAVKASMAEQTYDKEIVVGLVRPAAQSVAARMNKTGDFAICMVEDDLATSPPTIPAPPTPRPSPMW